LAQTGHRPIEVAGPLQPPQLNGIAAGRHFGSPSIPVKEGGRDQAGHAASEVDGSRSIREGPGQFLVVGPDDLDGEGDVPRGNRHQLPAVPAGARSVGTLGLRRVCAFIMTPAGRASPG
jgi:hypothetical protein